MIYMTFIVLVDAVCCRHFLACCTRILDVTTARMKKGHIQLMLSGRSISLLSVHPGIEPMVVQLKAESSPRSPESAESKIIILAIDNAKVTRLLD